MAQHVHERSAAAEERVVAVGDAALHVVLDGAPDAPALLLIHGLGASAVWWEPVVPCLARAYRVIRVDMAGHGGSTSPADGYGVPAQARRIAAVLDALGVERIAVAAGHSTGGSVATALAELRPAAVAALALIGTGPSPEMDTSDSALSRLLFRPVPGRLLWRAFAGLIVRTSLGSAFTRPVEVPAALAAATRAMTHHALASTALGSIAYIEEQTVPDRLTALGKPALVVFGDADRRWRAAASAEAYWAVSGTRIEMLPGVGHTPMYEDPETMCSLLTEFAASTV